MSNDVENPQGTLICDHCGQAFIATEGDVIRIDHFRDCPGLNDGEDAEA